MLQQDSADGFAGVYEESIKIKTLQPLNAEFWKLLFERNQIHCQPLEVVMSQIALNNPHTTVLHVTRKAPDRLIYSSFIFLVQVATG